MALTYHALEDSHTGLGVESVAVTMYLDLAPPSHPSQPQNSAL